MSKFRLDAFLSDNGYFESRARAASAVKAGMVLVDGEIARKPSQKIAGNSVIEAREEHPWVSRAGVKLAHALEIFKVNTENRICLDVGASTGGFTQVLLRNHADKVYAVDVGREQLHKRLLKHPKVVSMEATDARDLTADMLDPLPDLIVCDASFISAMKVLKQSLSLMNPGAELITLVKPQFEVGAKNLGKGGIVKTPELSLEALETVKTWATAQGWQVLATDLSPIFGGDGNTEYLLYARKK